jgi:hypothetical protein
MIIELKNKEGDFVLVIEADDRSAGMEGGYLPNDIYIAKRNTGWHLLRCDNYSEKYGCVYARPTKTGQMPYAYDSGECHRVLSIKTGVDEPPGIVNPIRAIDFDLE